MIAYSVLWLLRVDSWVYTWNQRGAEDDISRAFIDMRCRKFCIRNGVANGSNIYNVVSDEYFKQRIKRYKPWMQPENWANQHLILWRNLFSMGLIPVCLRTLWEGYSQNRKYRILHLKLCRPIRTASHSLLLSKQGGRQAYPIGRLKERGRWVYRAWCW